jgi:hypothetical protein
MVRNRDKSTFSVEYACHIHKWPALRKVFYRSFEAKYFLHKIVNLSNIFWNITPCRPLKVNWRFGGTYCLNLQDRRISWVRYECESRWQVETFTPVFCTAYSSILNMEAIVSSETSVDFQQSTRRYISEESTLHYHCCEDLKSEIVNFITAIDCKLQSNISLQRQCNALIFSLVFACGGYCCVCLCGCVTQTQQLSESINVVSAAIWN